MEKVSLVYQICNLRFCVILDSMLFLFLSDECLVKFRKHSIPSKMEYGFDLCQLIASDSAFNFQNNLFSSRHFLFHGIEPCFVKNLYAMHATDLVACGMNTSPLFDHPNDLVIRNVQKVGFYADDCLRLATRLNDV